jgi:hypothetical protein
MVVKRNTRNEGSTHRNPTVPRVQPLLKCATSCRVRTLWMDGGARGHHTERCLQVNGSHHDRITQLVIHHPQSEAQQLLPVAPSSDRTQRRGERLASHSWEAGLSQGHPHIARYNTTTCQQLPTPQKETLHRAAQPLSTGWVRTRHWGLDDIAASCHFESRNCRVR